MTWKPYKLDHEAQTLVIDHRDKKDVLTESHKMRIAVAYGLERFWGEHLRFEKDTKDRAKSEYWRAVWIQLGDILKEVDIELPDKQGEVKLNETDKIKKVSQQIWEMETEDRQVALMILTELCNSLVWWTQRYKIRKDGN